MIDFIVISKNMISCIEIRDKLDAAGVYKVQTSPWWGGVVAWYGMSTSGNLKKVNFFGSVNVQVALQLSKQLKQL